MSDLLAAVKEIDEKQLCSNLSAVSFVCVCVCFLSSFFFFMFFFNITRRALILGQRRIRVGKKMAPITFLYEDPAEC